jgi:hypothetical protein
MLIAVLKILCGDPLLVWAILYSIHTIETRIVPVPILFLEPAIFIGLQYKIFISGDLKLMGTYFSALGLGFLVGLFLGRSLQVRIIPSSISVELPEEFHTLAMLLSLFATRFTFGCLSNVSPTFVLQFSSLVTIITAIFPGVFLGRNITFFYKYWSYRG